MEKSKKYIGKKYNSLTINDIVDVVKTKSGSYLIVANSTCDCGSVKDYYLSNIIYGKSKSCGCLISKKTIERNFKHGDGSKKNKHYLYETWCGIKKRCYNPKCKEYPYYGGRESNPIKMYEPWINNYLEFKNWVLENLGERPEGYSLDRENNDGNYEPDNLRWLNSQGQANNRRKRKKIKNYG